MSISNISGHDESLEEEYNELISSLPREKGWYVDIYEYQGFWYTAKHLQSLLSTQKIFHTQDSDIFIASHPKTGTTWLKAIMFTLLNRERHPVSNNNHPLLSHNPHDLIHFLESSLNVNRKIPDHIALCSSPRVFSTHFPYAFLPQSVKNSLTCKMVYVGRNPKDTFVSFWHFSNKLRLQEMGGVASSVEETGASSFEEVFEKFCKGISPYGPIWDHALGYWEESKKNPDKVFFLKYEEMSEKSTLVLRRLAEFLNCPFSADEEESGVVEKILKLCSFKNLRALEVNKIGNREYAAENNLFFRKGNVGDYKNHLTNEMIEKLDQITRDKFFGSGLEL